MSMDLIPKDIREKFEIHEWKHACSILSNDFPEEWSEILNLLREFKLCKSWITSPGGRKSQVSEFIDSYLYQRGWQSHVSDSDK